MTPQDALREAIEAVENNVGVHDMNVHAGFLLEDIDLASRNEIAADLVAAGCKLDITQPALESWRTVSDIARAIQTQ